MALTEAQKTAWLSNDNHRIVLIDMETHDGASLVVERFASHPYVMPFGDVWNTYSNLMYDDIVYHIPNITTKIDADTTIGSISLYNEEGTYDHLLQDTTVVGHKLQIYIGQEDWIRDNFIPIMDGVVEGISSSGPENITISLRDKKESLNIPLQTDLYEKDGSTLYWDLLMNDIDNAGSFTGYIYGSEKGYDRSFAVLPDSIENTHVPICIGKCFNIEPVLIDSFNHVYQIHEGPITEVTEIRSNGKPLNGTGSNPVYSMAIGTYWGSGSGGNFIIGETIVGTNQHYPDRVGIVTGYSGSKDTVPDPDYVLYYEDVGDLPFSSVTGGFEGQTSGSKSNAVDPVVVSDGTDGQYEVDLDYGVIRLLDHDQGMQITCDVIGQRWPSSLRDGAAPTLTPYSAADIIEWLVLEKGALGKDEICYDTFDPVGSKAFGNDDEMGIYYRSEQNILSVISNIINPIGGFMRFKSTICKLQIYRLEDPLGKDIDLYLADDDLIQNGLSIGQIEEPKRSITLGYKKNWKIQDEGSLAGALKYPGTDYYDLNLVETYISEYSSVYADNSATITPTIYPLAEDVDTIETFLWDADAAEAEVDRRAALRLSRRRIFKVQSVATPFSYDIGDIVHITHSRFGFDSGKNAMIVGIEEFPTAQRVNLEVWL